MYRKLIRRVYVEVIQKRSYNKNHVKVRFAPSPTGQLHLGSLRTALYNYLFARANNGSFIIRIEDTDQSRAIPGMIEKVYNDLVWAGIIPDEDPIRGGPNGPYIQSKRLDIYRAHIQLLLENESAYYCFCSEDRLDLIRKEALRNRQVPKYDNKCRHLTKDAVNEKLLNKKPHCIRFKLSEVIEPFDDLIYGKVLHDISLSEGDPIILKSDGYPTYHFANVVDDHLMEITHVLRGVEWQVSTPKHILLYKAFKWTPPIFGHLPLLLGSDGSKLSKRKNDVYVESYRSQGIFPLALLNYIILAGGGFNSERDSTYIDSYEQLIKHFNISKIKPSSGKLSPERLLEFNRLEIAKLIANNKNKKFLIERVKKLVTDALHDRKAKGNIQLDENHILSVLHWAQNRVHSLNDLVKPDLLFLWTIPSDEQNILDAKLSGIVTALSTNLAEQTPANFNADWLNDFLKKFVNDNNVQYVAFMRTLRVILSGVQTGPPVAEIIEILGKDTTLERINRCLK